MKRGNHCVSVFEVISFFSSHVLCVENACIYRFIPFSYLVMYYILPKCVCVFSVDFMHVTSIFMLSCHVLNIERITIELMPCCLSRVTFVPFRHTHTTGIFYNNAHTQFNLCMLFILFQ